MNKILILGLLLIALSCSQNVVRESKSDPLKLYVLNVGNAACMIFHCPGSSEALIYDCGKRRDTPKDKLRQELFPLLQNKKLTLILSHAHSDHDNFIPEIRKKFSFEKIYYGGQVKDYPFDLSNAEAFPRGRGPDLTCGEAQFKILISNDAKRENNSSTVLFVKHGKVTMLLPSDATDKVEKKALEQISKEKLLEGNPVDLLFGSHHGDQGRGSNGEVWAKTLKPRHVIFSSGLNDTFKPPYCVVKDRYEPFLKQTASHTFSCAESKTELKTFETDLAQYTTRDSKKLLVTSDGRDLKIDSF